MYYELYIDVFFLVNFMMDYLLLLIARRMLLCTATYKNVCLGALAGALLTCLVVVIPIPYAFVKFVLFHIVVNTLMITIGLRIRDMRTFLKALIVLYAGAFLLGGVFEYLHSVVRVGSLFFALAVLSYYLVRGIWGFLSRLMRVNQYRCRVRLHWKERSFTVNAIIDTGNGLRDTLTNRPVCILDKRAVGKLLEGEAVQGIRYIPYHTIGKAEGVMPVITIEKMYVERDRDYLIETPLIGVCEEAVSEQGEYEMILNPDIF